MTVRAGKQVVTVRDLLAGEVWVCSGQSNMQMSVAASLGAEEELPRAGDCAAAAFQDRQDRLRRARAGRQGTLAALRAVERGGFLGRGLLLRPGAAPQVEDPCRPDHGGLGRHHRGGLDRPGLACRRRRVRAHPAPLERAAHAQSRSAAGRSPVQARDRRHGACAARRIAPGTFGTGGDGGLGSARVWRLVARHDQPRLPSHFLGFPWDRRIGERPASTWAARSSPAIPALRLRARGQGAFSLQLRQPSVVDGAWHAVPSFFARPDWTEYTFRLADFVQPSWGEQKPLTLDRITGVALCVESAMAVPEQPSSLFNCPC